MAPLVSMRWQVWKLRRNAASRREQLVKAYIRFGRHKNVTVVTHYAL